MQVLFLLALLAFGPAKPWREPHIISQRSDMVFPEKESPRWERHIMVRNPLAKPVWFWIECESQLTTVAIGLTGHHTSEYVFPDIPPTEQCMMHTWQLQVPGKSPAEWIP